MTVEPSGPSVSRRGPIVRTVVGLSFLAAIWFIAGDAERRSSIAAVGLGGLAALAILAGCGSVLISASWAVVAGRHVGMRSAFVEYIVYQPAKYLPGGIAQGMLQMSHVRGALGSWGRSSGVFVIHMAVLATGGGLLAIPAVVEGFGALIAVLACLAVGLIASLALRLSRRFGVSTEVVPAPVELIGALLLAAGGLGLWGLGYGMTISGMVGGEFDVSEVWRFAAGWLAGFLALPIPAGIGIREAALGALSDHPVAVVIAASIVVRLAVAAAEFVMALLGLMVSRVT